MEVVGVAVRYFDIGRVERLGLVMINDGVSCIVTSSDRECVSIKGYLYHNLRQGFGEAIYHCRLTPYGKAGRPPTSQSILDDSPISNMMFKFVSECQYISPLASWAPWGRNFLIPPCTSRILSTSGVRGVGLGEEWILTYPHSHQSNTVASLNAPEPYCNPSPVIAQEL